MKEQRTDGAVRGASREEETTNRRGCTCRCCDHSEGSDCGCDCHATGHCSYQPEVAEASARPAPSLDAQRTVASIAAMLGWMNVPPRETLEADIRALKARVQDAAALDASRFRLVREVLADLGLGVEAPQPNIQSVQRRLHVGTADAMRLLALREAVKSSEGSVPLDASAAPGGRV